MSWGWCEGQVISPYLSPDLDHSLPFLNLHRDCDPRKSSDIQQKPSATGTLVRQLVVILKGWKQPKCATLSYRKINCCAGFCALTGLFTMGILSHVWYDSRIFLLSIVCAALSFAYIKIEREESVEATSYVDITSGSMDIELNEQAEHDKVSRRMYLHVLKKKQKNNIMEAKEFSNTEDFIKIAKEKTENEEYY